MTQTAALLLAALTVTAFGAPVILRELRNHWRDQLADRDGTAGAGFSFHEGAGIQ